MKSLEQQDILEIDRKKYIGKNNEFAPPAYEAIASRISNALSADHFARYDFLSSTDSGYCGFVSGYSASKERVACIGTIDGVEEVYAVALVLGLEIRSMQCIKENDRVKLYIDDFTRPFHALKSDGGLLIVCRGGTVLSGSIEGSLFPRKFVNSKCGEWINQSCDLAKLQSAYQKAISKREEALDLFTSTVEESRYIENSLGLLFKDLEFCCAKGEVLEEALYHNYDIVTRLYEENFSTDQTPPWMYMCSL